LSYIHGDLDGDGVLSPREILRMLYIGENKNALMFFVIGRSLISHNNAFRHDGSILGPGVSNLGRPVRG
jgi:hypothetical protein